MIATSPVFLLSIIYSFLQKSTFKCDFRSFLCIYIVNAKITNIQIPLILLQKGRRHWDLFLLYFNDSIKVKPVTGKSFYNKPI